MVFKKPGDLSVVHGRTEGVRGRHIQNHKPLSPPGAGVHGGPQNGGHAAVHDKNLPNRQLPGPGGYGSQAVEGSGDLMGTVQEGMGKGGIIQGGLEDLMTVV